MHNLTATVPSRYSVAILAALQVKPIYHGTVPADTKAARRAANKRARAARRANRVR